MKDCFPIFLDVRVIKIDKNMFSRVFTQIIYVREKRGR